jgi:hypothetical protein
MSRAQDLANSRCDTLTNNLALPLTFHKMQLANLANGKRLADDAFPTFDTFDFNSEMFQNHTSPYKRARLINQSRDLAYEWNWSTATTDNEYQRSTTAAISFPHAPLVSFPHSACFLSTMSASASGRDIPAKRPRPPQSTDVGKNTPVKTSSLEASGPSQSSPSNSNRNPRGLVPRRRPFPGENAPRLAATWRETTSSRGAENTFSARSREQLNHVTTSIPNVSSSGSVTEAFESYEDRSIASRRPSSALDFNLVEEQLNVNSTGPGHEGAHHENTLSNTEFEQEWPTTLTTLIDFEFPNTEPATANNALFCTTDPGFSALFGDSSGIEIPLEGFGSMSPDAQNVSSFQMPVDDTFGTFTDLSSDFFDFLPPQKSRQQSTTYGFEPGGNMEREDNDLGTHGARKCDLLSSNTFSR